VSTGHSLPCAGLSAPFKFSKDLSVRPCTIPVAEEVRTTTVMAKKIVSLGVRGYCWWLAQLSLMAIEVRQLRTHRTVGGLACEPAGDEP
jgi:hypothetical protein